MRLDIKTLKETPIPESVVEFMTAHGTNHQLLLEAWKAPGTKAFGENLKTLVLCLAFEMQKKSPKKAIVKRLRGRISKVRQADETFDFDFALNPEMSFLG